MPVLFRHRASLGGLNVLNLVLAVNHRPGRYSAAA